MWDSYDVTLASIVVTSSSADQLSVSVLAWTRTGKVSITAQYMADTNAEIKSQLQGGLKHDNPGAQYTGVTARRVLSYSGSNWRSVGLTDFQWGPVQVHPNRVLRPITTLITRENRHRELGVYRQGKDEFPCTCFCPRM